jgi:hypothetical protein
VCLDRAKDPAHVPEILESCPSRHRCKGKRARSKLCTAALVSNASTVSGRGYIAYRHIGDSESRSALMIPFIFISSNLARVLSQIREPKVNVKPPCVVLLQSVSVPGADSLVSSRILRRVMRGPIGFLIVSCSSLTGRQY